MGAVVGLGVGVGLLLIWSAFALPRTSAPREPEPGRIARLLVRSGLESASVSGFVLLCVASASSPRW